MRTKLKHIVSRFPDLGNVIARFPIPTILMVVFTMIFIFESPGYTDKETGLLLFGLVIAAYTAFCIVIASEVRTLSRVKTIVLQIIAAAFIVMLARHSEGLRLNIFMALGAILLTLGNMAAARFWPQFRGRGVEDVDRINLHSWDFTHKIWTGALFATVGSVIFFLGIMAIQETLRSLFGFNIKDVSRELILPIGLGVLAPLFWLSTVPKVDEDFTELYENPGFVSKSVAFLGTWLLAPLTLIYALILLAYGVKIVLDGSLPKGEIGTLTLPFLGIGTLTWLLLCPPFVNKKMLARLYRKIWFPISVPAAGLLAVAIGVRIHEYGFTPERIALSLGVVWAGVIALWFIFAPKSKRDIRIIPGLAACMLLIGCLGADRISLSSQAERFEDGLLRSGVVSEKGVIIEDSTTITDMDAARKAKSALQYLNRHNGGDIAQTILSKYGFERKTATLSDQLSELGLADVETAVRRSKYVNYLRERADINIAGYDQLYMSNFNLNSTINSTYKTHLVDDGAILITQEGMDLVVSHNASIGGGFETHDELVRYDLMQIVSTLSRDGNKLNVNEEGYVLLEGDQAIKLYIERANFFDNVDRQNSADAPLQDMNWNMKISILTRGLGAQ